MKKLLFTLVALLLNSAVVVADNRLQLVGQFGSKAVLLINGSQRIIKINQPSPEGIKLLRIESDYVIVSDNGVTKKVTYTTQLSAQYEKREVNKVDIWADNTGSYVTSGTINGQVVDLLVDTGATSVAMNEVVARHLGIDFRYIGTPIRVTTASGNVTGYRIKLDTVKVGTIQISNVDAVVLEGGHPERVLLGMSFLKHVSLERNDNLMTLKY